MDASNLHQAARNALIMAVFIEATAKHVETLSEFQPGQETTLEELAVMFAGNILDDVTGHEEEVALAAECFGPKIVEFGNRLMAVPDCDSITVLQIASELGIAF